MEKGNGDERTRTGKELGSLRYTIHLCFCDVFKSLYLYDLSGDFSLEILYQVLQA